MSDIRFNQWLHQSGTGGVSQVDGGHVGIGTTNPDIAVHTANTKKINVGIVTANSVYAGAYYGDGSNLTGLASDKIEEGDTKVEVVDSGSQYIVGEVNGTERLRITSAGKIIIGNSGTAYGNGAVQSFIAHTANAGTSGFNSIDTTSVAAGVGGEISFYGKFNTGAQDYAYLGHIRGIKENATAGNTACALTFHTRPTATAPSEKLRIGSEGNLALGGTNTSAYANQSYFFIGAVGNLYADTASGSGNSLSLSNNAYINTSGNWVYRVGDKASNIYQYNGDIGFRTAGTGSAGNTISWSERLRIDSTGKIGINRAATEHPLEIQHASEPTVSLWRGSTKGAALQAQSGGTYLYSYQNAPLIFSVNSANGFSERVRITSGGQLLIGTTTAVRALTIKDPGQIHVESTSTGNWVGMSIKGSSGTNNYNAYFGVLDSNGKFFIDNSSNGADIEIESGASGQKAGRVLVGPSVPTSGDDSQMIIRNNPSNGIYRCLRLNNDSNNNRITMTFEGNGTATGDIRLNGSTTSYNSYSDYRLKENVVPLTDPVTRLKTLKPYRFNFIASPDITLDGFFAHEVSPAVAEAVGGEKDEVDKDGNVIPQALDMAKLVPLLTASLQEAFTKIETLEAEVAVLKSS